MALAGPGRMELRSRSATRSASTTRSPAMAIRLVGSPGTLAVLIGAAVLGSHSIAGQEQGAAPPLVVTAFGDKPAPPFASRHTSWGDPDLQGVWSSDDTAGIPMSR